MAEIIKPGNTHKVAKCNHCECIFSYLSYEAYKDEGHYYIICPDCFNATIIENPEENIKQEA